ncbi:arsenate-mycothiol transferase ArsC [Azohydromonas lata]|uniref:protein-tyrosine-phosphatase n=1 Tax=Azohydromonas lata TaxID=45677 RepID=A0ABU5IM64_9BURK|nr:hypothetical protein [Azohydromonas lata]MDZ5459982.1 hypothetical protein [Azohydromonas lata]
MPPRFTPPINAFAAAASGGTLRRFWGRLGLRMGFYAGMATPFTRPDWSTAQRLVFVCLANLNRSALAQALCEQSGIPTASCGLYTVTGRRCFSSTVRVAADMGVALQRHHASHWLDFAHRDGDLYLVMEPRHAEHLLRRGVPAQRIALLGHWARPRRLRIRDPYGRSELELRRCFELIRSAVSQLAAELQAQGAVLCRPGQAGMRKPVAGGVQGAEPGPAVA